MISKNYEVTYWSEREIKHIDGNTTELPSAQIIKQILMEEQKFVNATFKLDEDLIEKMSIVYELTYAIVDEFLKHNISIFLGFGSHLGARRHHGIIPFGEKDVDFQVFSLDGTKVKSIINNTLKMKSTWRHLEFITTTQIFGYQVNLKEEHRSGLSHYMDFWLFDENYKGDKVKCIGLGRGCDEWYKRYHDKATPEFSRDSYFPPLYQVFGSHKVPIPAKSTELETFQYGAENWNITCGTHRLFDDEKRKWVEVPVEERKCSALYEKYPFVFSMGSREQLRQGKTLLHESVL